ncbi:SDR family oxidoreductase [Actinocrispum wychmicini]|uniref:NAD(P)-dependent dehydrogenase (Short-subunit alcohol dehydrogenase family) n=1 Tax=Actinocrispum wychmicini TaxID=1213861 RepID=A0A4R2JWK3_9PSEU|nr:SDR family oxidoreductase [Actinocrispum wychmicini]TCO64843.1 NAD(P)-dependent dehydrogenase (short-subunit alcohol dehydrogenase family) [Actinocrispum wychmicini]
MGVVIVTGGSRGIGAAICRQVSEQGHTVVVNYAGDQAAADAVADDTGGLAVRANVADEADVVRLFDAAEELGTLTGVVCNAGITGTFGRLDGQSLDSVRKVFETNVYGVFLGNREAVRRMSTKYGRGGGVIVNISSTAAKRGSPGEWVHYAASKSAVETLTYGLAQEVADEGIRVNCVAPGMVDTDMHAAAGIPDRLDRVAPSIPLKRAGRPDEIAEGVAWLLSDAASYVVGSVLTISGGR